MENKKQFLNIKEASALTGFTVSTIYRKVSQKTMPGAYKVGNKALRFDREELIQWIKSKPKPVGQKIELKDE